MAKTGTAAGSADGAAALGTGGPRSEGTRRAILEAARSAFAARGYEQTTIRGVAAEAGVDASMVMRYFGSKAGLFTAAATANLTAPDLLAVPARQRGEVLVRTFVDRWEDAATRDELMLLLRAAVTSEAVAARLQATLGQLITAPIAALGEQDAAERGSFIATQLLGLTLCRYILRLEPLASLPASDVVAAVAPSVQRYLIRPAVTAGLIRRPRQALTPPSSLARRAARAGPASPRRRRPRTAAKYHTTPAASKQAA